MTNPSTHRVTAVLPLALAASTAFAQAQRRPAAAPNFDVFYELGPDSLLRRGVPKGTVKGPVTLPSQVYPGVTHDYWVYVPAQYDGKTEVSLMVFNDGATYTQPDGYYRAVNVLDNLIYRGELPVMIAAFIDPGKFTKDGASNRQAEYDPPDARYSRVIVDELLPKLYAEYRRIRDAGDGGRLTDENVRPGRPRIDTRVQEETFVPTYLGAIDQGTSSTRFIVFEESTRIVAESQIEHEQIEGRERRLAGGVPFTAVVELGFFRGRCERLRGIFVNDVSLWWRNSFTLTLRLGLV